MRFIIYRNNKRVQLKPMSLTEIFNRTKNLCGGTVKNLIDAGYSLKQA